MTTTSEWACWMTPLVRGLINDLDEDNQIYEDTRIHQLIVTSAQLLKPELDFNNTYTINIAAQTISPDPTSNYDDGFINLVSMKAALMIMAGEVKDAANTSIRITDAAATIDNSSSYLAKKSLYNQMVEDFSRAKIQYAIGNMNAMKAILSPYAVFNNAYSSLPINNIIFG